MPLAVIDEGYDCEWDGYDTDTDTDTDALCFAVELPDTDVTGNFGVLQFFYPFPPASAIRFMKPIKKTPPPVVPDKRRKVKIKASPAVSGSGA